MTAKEETNFFRDLFAYARTVSTPYVEAYLQRKLGEPEHVRRERIQQEINYYNALNGSGPVRPDLAAKHSRVNFPWNFFVGPQDLDGDGIADTPDMRPLGVVLLIAAIVVILAVIKR